MSKKIEKLLKDYPRMLQERNCVAHEIASFRGVTAEEVIESMYTPRADNERARINRLSDKTAQIAVNYKNKMSRINYEWLGHLEAKLRLVNNELIFFEAALSSLSSMLPSFMRDLVVNNLTWDAMQCKYNISRFTVGAYRKKALAELDNLYSIHEKESIAFMLQ